MLELEELLDEELELLDELELLLEVLELDELLDELLLEVLELDEELDELELLAAGLATTIPETVASLAEALNTSVTLPSEMLTLLNVRLVAVL